MILSRRFTVSQEETSCMYMPLLHQVMKWNTSCTQSLIHFPALSAAAAIRSYHVLKILKDYGYRSRHKRQWTISDPLPFTLHGLKRSRPISTTFSTAGSNSRCSSSDLLFAFFLQFIRNPSFFSYSFANQSGQVHFKLSEFLNLWRTCFALRTRCSLL